MRASWPVLRSIPVFLGVKSIVVFLFSFFFFFWMGELRFGDCCVGLGKRRCVQ